MTVDGIELAAISGTIRRLRPRFERQDTGKVRAPHEETTISPVQLSDFVNDLKSGVQILLDLLIIDSFPRGVCPVTSKPPLDLMLLLLNRP
jgi:hypothetical protein